MIVPQWAQKHPFWAVAGLMALFWVMGAIAAVGINKLVGQ